MTLIHGPDVGPVTRDIDRAAANRIWGAILPTYRTPAAARLRDVSPLIDALRNPRAVELVAARLEQAGTAGPSRRVPSRDLEGARR